MEERPIIPTAKVNADTRPEEVFQNAVLRPIIKMTHDLLIAHTRYYLAQKKHDFAFLNPEKKLKYVISCFERDQTLRSELRGLIMGHFTVIEYGEYTQMRNAINKRMLTIIKERMMDHIAILSD